MFTERLKTQIKSVPVLSGIYHAAARAYDRRGRNLAYARQTIASIATRVSQPVFVKVGANDGVTGDPLSDILLPDPRWRGLLIEPVPYCFERLKLHFGDSKRFALEQVAIGERAETNFYYVAQDAIQHVPGLGEKYDQLGSFNKEHILKHDGAFAPYIIECKVKVCTLDDVLERNGIEDFHLLHIDCEGADFEVLKTLDLAGRGPLTVFIEHVHLSTSQKEEMIFLLKEHGYSVRDCGQDYFALRRRRLSVSV